MGLQIVLTKLRTYQGGAICSRDAQVGSWLEEDSCAASFAIPVTKNVRPVPHDLYHEDLVRTIRSASPCLRSFPPGFSLE